MIIEGLLDVLFKASGGENAVFCIPGSEKCFEPPGKYLTDTITEKVFHFLEYTVQARYIRALEKNELSKSMSRVAAASGLAQDFLKVLPSKLRIVRARSIRVQYTVIHNRPLTHQRTIIFLIEFCNDGISISDKRFVVLPYQINKNLQPKKKQPDYILNGNVGQVKASSDTGNDWFSQTVCGQVGKLPMRRYKVKNNLKYLIFFINS